MTRGGPTSARPLRKVDIPLWIRVDDDGAIWTTHGSGGITVVERRAEWEFADGYLGVFIAGGRHLAHRVVYAWFHGEAPAGVLIRHLDDCRHNNRPSNLALGDHAANMRDAVLAGAHAKKLTSEIVGQIRDAFRSGVKQSELAARFAVARPTIHKIVHRQTWTHV